jgi:streptogramin lyase
MVHDADYNSDDGMVWYTDFGSQFLGKLDPKSGEVVEYPIPVAKPGFEHGSNDVRFDRDGNAWVGNMSQGQLVKFDKKTQKVQAFPFPAEVNISPNIAMVMPYHAHVDGKVWTNNTSYNAIMRYDVNTGDWDTVYIYDKWTRDAFDHGVYGINSDAENNLFVFNVQGNTLIRVDAKTLDVKYYETPTPQSGPRRGRFDSEYRLWVALSEVDKVAMFDPKTERFREWDAPDPMAQTYDIMSDEQGSVWYGGTTSDFVYRLNPETGQQARYLLPKIHTNIRRVDVDTAETGRPIFWVGDNHGAAIYKLEPLD